MLGNVPLQIDRVFDIQVCFHRMNKHSSVSLRNHVECSYTCASNVQTKRLRWQFENTCRVASNNQIISIQPLCVALMDFVYCLLCLSNCAWVVGFYGNGWWYTCFYCRMSWILNILKLYILQKLHCSFGNNAHNQAWLKSWHKAIKLAVKVILLTYSVILLLKLFWKGQETKLFFHTFVHAFISKSCIRSTLSWGGYEPHVFALW